MHNRITDYLWDAVDFFPERIAYEDVENKMTFKEIQNSAYHIAFELINRKINKKPVMVYLDKSVESIVSFLGILFSGNYYVPIDINLPNERINNIIEILSAEIIITKNEILQQDKDILKLECINYDDTQKSDFDEERIIESAKKIIDKDVAYVLFTSGSTGIPKGVVISHRAVIDYIEWFKETFGIGQSDVLGNQAAFHFDLSVQDIFLPLVSGCRTVIIPKQYYAFPRKLFQYMIERKVNSIVWVPTALCVIANWGILSKGGLPQLSRIMFCGEVMPTKQLNKWREAYPKAIFVNMYGPTEATDACTYYIVNREFNDDEALPIGVACQNTEIIVLNEKNEIVKKNEVGELCIRGSCLANGYYNQPEITEKVFVQNPLNSSFSEIIYRTGDLVKYNDKGELIYISRKDFQIKHKGYRIELGEIETVVSSFTGVDGNCCFYDEISEKIVLVYSGKIEKEQIRKYIEQSLPEYMVPEKFIQLDIMPINANGKIDRNLLRKEYTNYGE